MFTFTRRQWWIACCASVAGVIVSLPVAQADDIASFRDQLRSVLKCRRDFEFVFIDRVAELVDEGKLPYAMVLALMKYSVRKRPHTPYPWFEQTIRLKANELGVDLEL